MGSPATVKAVTERISGELRARRDASLKRAQGAARVLNKAAGELVDRLGRDTIRSLNTQIVDKALDVQHALMVLVSHEAEARRFKDHLIAFQNEELSKPSPKAGSGEASDDATSPEADAEAQAGDEPLVMEDTDERPETKGTSGEEPVNLEDFPAKAEPKSKAKGGKGRGKGKPKK